MLFFQVKRFNEFAACQNGGIVAYLHEHGSDSGCGDNNWPKTVGFLAGWGYGHATLNGKPLVAIGSAFGQYGGVWAQDDARKAFDDLFNL